MKQAYYFFVSVVKAWLWRRQNMESEPPQVVQRAWADAFRESAVPFADQLIDENRALFEELARL